MREARGEVVVTWPDYLRDDPEFGARLVAAGHTIRLAPKLASRTPEELSMVMDGAIGAIVSTDPFDASVFAAAPTLRVIARVGVGVDSIDLAAATAAGVAVTITSGANAATTADHTVALMLAALRRVAEHDASIRRGEWNRTGAYTPWQLTGATVGLIGYGTIGQLVAARVRGFEARVLVHDPVPPVDDRVEHVPFDELLRRSDVVSLHAPLLPSTEGLIGARELAVMRPDTILVNTSRGALIDEAALIDALEQGRLRAAALDVFEEEPPPSARLRALRNAVMTPHIGGVSEQSVREMTRRATTSVLEALAGRCPGGLVNAEVLAHEHFLGDGLAEDGRGARIGVAPTPPAGEAT
jgi:phosphoglycerate dehydrogenase-like enzyme